jgi:hypothetical protein
VCCSPLITSFALPVAQPNTVSLKKTSERSVVGPRTPMRLPPQPPVPCALAPATPTADRSTTTRAPNPEARRTMPVTLIDMNAGWWVTRVPSFIMPS